MEHSAQNELNITIDNQQLILKTGSENLKPKSWHHFGTFLNAGLNEKEKCPI